jgi:hypothetical protein
MRLLRGQEATESSRKTSGTVREHGGRDPSQAFLAA